MREPKISPDRLDRPRGICHGRRTTESDVSRVAARGCPTPRSAAPAQDVSACWGNWIESTARMTSPSKTQSQRLLAPDRLPAGDYYTTSIKLFHLFDGGPAILASQALFPMPPGAPIPGHLCRAARILLDETQEWLWKAAKVSRKTINDFENGLIEPKIALNNHLRTALEKAGASFVTGDGVIGVVVYSRPKPKSTS